MSLGRRGVYYDKYLMNRSKQGCVIMEMMEIALNVACFLHAIVELGFLNAVILP